jgi:RNA polymerase sigma factor (sigma-70 family)
VNNSRSVLRRRGTARKHLRVIVEETDDAADQSSMLTAEHEMVRAALVELPDRQREVLTLRYIADLSDQAIAEATGLSPGGVRSASSRGLAALRISLGGRL